MELQKHSFGSAHPCSRCGEFFSALWGGGERLMCEPCRDAWIAEQVALEAGPVAEDAPAKMEVDGEGETAKDAKATRAGKEKKTKIGPSE